MLACLTHVLKPERVIPIIPETLPCLGPSEKEIESFRSHGGKLLREILEEKTDGSSHNFVNIQHRSRVQAV